MDWKFERWTLDMRMITHVPTCLDSCLESNEKAASGGARSTPSTARLALVSTLESLRARPRPAGLSPVETQRAQRARAAPIGHSRRPQPPNERSRTRGVRLQARDTRKIAERERERECVCVCVCVCVCAFFNAVLLAVEILMGSTPQSVRCSPSAGCCQVQAIPSPPLSTLFPGKSSLVCLSPCRRTYKQRHSGRPSFR